MRCGRQDLDCELAEAERSDGARHGPCDWVLLCVAIGASGFKSGSLGIVSCCARARNLLCETKGYEPCYLIWVELCAIGSNCM